MLQASIIIPTFNASERLLLNLNSLNYQNYPKELFEVIVIDDGSTDNTYSILCNLQTEYKLKIIRLRENKGRSKARNTGIYKAESELIIFHDSDMIAEKDYVMNHIIGHKDKKTIVCGPSWKKIFSFYYKNFNEYLKKDFKKVKHKYNVDEVLINSKDKYQLIGMQQIIDGSFMNYAFEMESRENAFRYIISKYGKDLEGYYLPWRFFITNNCSVNKQELLYVGLFDENYIGWGCEDYDLGYRLYKNGCKFIRDYSAISVHQEHPTSIKNKGMENIYYFCDKYPCIDISLLYFYKLTSINKDWINEIIKESEELAKIPKYHYLIEVYRNLLKFVILRYKNGICKPMNISKKSSANNLIDFNLLNELEKDVLKNLHFNFFCKSLRILIEDCSGLR